MLNALNIESLSKSELKKILRKGEKRLETLNARRSAMDFSEDERVCAVANEILTLAYKTRIPKAEVFAAVAGNMRQSLEDVLPHPESVSDNSETVAENAAVETTKEAIDPSILIQGTLGGEERSANRTLKLPRPRKTPSLNVAGNDERRPSRQKRSKNNRDNKAERAESMGSSQVVYRHPVDAYKTWDGRGAMPKWLRDAVSFGRKLEEFRVANNVQSDR